MITINNYIKNIGDKLFISHNSTERTNINLSIDSIKKKLNYHFGNNISEIILFGSYTRGTILPRKYDTRSDIDIMVVFNTNDYNEKTPETYRNNLKKFADLKYPRSLVSKDLPSIVIELQKIKFDLVPAIISTSWFSSKTYIPNSGNEWQETDPNGFNNDLTQANQQYGNIVKPIIRLMKYWNTRNNSPYESFDLEQIISEMNFSRDNFESGFFYAIDQLPVAGRSTFLKNKVEILRTNKDWILEYLKRENTIKAKERLHKILP
ncbi:SMODS domain-containing nucleotidyltransferase [Tenacibaculum finnmarkense]|uniref:SMODS domain-containing nucleotidyltransferase n=1 Tax=Tenacibaculum finnmarkense TaxID=2781243 RepID=UPI001EFB2873|nr:nucleotidyltransferase domain-containing protein [Tenacibaculum finnmarkense]